MKAQHLELIREAGTQSRCLSAGNHVQVAADIRSSQREIETSKTRVKSEERQTSSQPTQRLAFADSMQLQSRIHSPVLLKFKAPSSELRLKSHRLHLLPGVESKSRNNTECAIKSSTEQAKSFFFYSGSAQGICSSRVDYKPLLMLTPRKPSVHNSNSVHGQHFPQF